MRCHVRHHVAKCDQFFDIVIGDCDLEPTLEPLHDVDDVHRVRAVVRNEIGVEAAGSTRSARMSSSTSATSSAKLFG